MFSTSSEVMESFTIEEFQADFDNLLDRVEGGQSFIITHEGKEVVMMPADNYEYIVNNTKEYDDLIQIYKDHEEGC